MNVTMSRDGQRRTTIRVHFRADAHLAALACIDAGLAWGASLYDRMERQQDWWNEDDEGEDYESRLERTTARITEVAGLD